MISNITETLSVSLVSSSNNLCHFNEKFSNALQLYNAVTKIYGRDLAQLVSDLQNDKHNGTDSTISREVEAFESVVFVHVYK